MSEIDILHQRLARLVQGPSSFSGPARALMSEGETDVLRALRTAIEETQLPRRLTFRNHTDAVLTFDVAGGRVLAFHPPGGDSSDASTGVISLKDTPDTTPITQAVCDFVATASTLWVETCRLDRPESTVDFGVSVDAFLPTSLEATADPQSGDGSHLLQRFFDESAGLSPAAMLLAGGVVAKERGGEDILRALRSLVEAEDLGSADAAAMTADPNAPCQCVIYAGAAPDRHGLMCLSHAGDLALVAFDPPSLGRLVRLWQSQT